jgi:hypothetical protein
VTVHGYAVRSMAGYKVGKHRPIGAFEWMAIVPRARADRTALLGTREVAELLNVHPPTVAQWGPHRSFPDPELRVGGSPAWRRSTVLRS